MAGEALLKVTDEKLDEVIDFPDIIMSFPFWELLLIIHL